MSIAAVLLVILSSFVHAGWNLIGKRWGSEAGRGVAFFFTSVTLGTAALIPLAVVFRHSYQYFPDLSWGLALVAGFFQALYYIGLAGTYRHGEMSSAYPLTRALPVLLVPLMRLVLGFHVTVSPVAVFGMVLIVAGLLLLPWSSFAEITPHVKIKPWVLFAFAGAMGTTGYSIVDDTALGLIRDAAGPASTIGSSHSVTTAIPPTMAYAFIEGIASVACLGLSGLIGGGLRPSEYRFKEIGWRAPLLMGVGVYLAYGLVLVAMAFARDVSYIVAFRQLSIPLGSVTGIVVLRERASLPKLAGLAAVSLGLLLVGIG